MDLSLYLVTDRQLAGERPIEEVVRQAISGGVTTVQLREKGTPSGEFLRIASSLRALTRKAGVTLIVNDRLDIALAAGTDGVHVGQEDLPAERARELLGTNRILGVTAADEEEARAAAAGGADYIGCNAVFSSTGVEGIAVVSAVVSANDPALATGELRSLINRKKQE